MELLSVVIITLNEERNIGRCLGSVQHIADEVIVVDSLSKDRTAEIARSMGAKLVEQPFLGHIEQKNFAIEQASHNLVLSLDADEALDDNLVKNVQDIKEKLVEDGYVMNRLTNYCGKWIRHCGWYPDRKIRLFKKDAGSWKGTNPHDLFTLNEGKTKGRLSGDILHYSFYTIAEHDRQIEKFTDIAAKAKYDEGARSSLLKLMVKPTAKFVKAFIIKAGFLDGYYGWVISTKSAYASYLRYKKLLALQRES